MRALSKPIPPTVVRVAAAILLGVATTVAVAWGLAFYVDGSITARLSEKFNTEVAIEPVPRPPGGGGVNTAEVVRSRRLGTEIVELTPVWSLDDRYQIISTHELLKGTSFEAEIKQIIEGQTPSAWWRADGLPLPAMSAEARWGYLGDDTVRVIGGMLIGSNVLSPGTAVPILPLQPIWIGLVINTVFYALLWFLLFSTGDIRYLLRAALRRRRGQCVRCGYTLQPEQTRCSECGELQR